MGKPRRSRATQQYDHLGAMRAILWNGVVMTWKSSFRVHDTPGVVWVYESIAMVLGSFTDLVDSEASTRSRRCEIGVSLLWAVWASVNMNGLCNPCSSVWLTLFLLSESSAPRLFACSLVPPTKHLISQQNHLDSTTTPSSFVYYLL